MAVEKNQKIVIVRRPAYRWVGVKAAAVKLGCSEQSLRLYLSGRTCSLGPAKRALISVKIEE